MLTWQVIDERDVGTYHMAGNPSYSAIANAMFDAKNKVSALLSSVSLSLPIFPPQL
jgi:hypothetical protein